MSGKPGSTLGFEKRLNRLLSLGSEDEFVQAITKETLPKPDTMMAVLARNQGRDQSA
jgi:hypothetical protein